MNIKKEREEIIDVKNEGGFRAYLFRKIIASIATKENEELAEIYAKLGDAQNNIRRNPLLIQEDCQGLINDLKLICIEARENLNDFNRQYNNEKAGDLSDQ
ncbi:hypothetical protein ACFTXL_09350 [Bacillus subtilis]